MRLSSGGGAEVWAVGTHLLSPAPQPLPQQRLAAGCFTTIPSQKTPPKTHRENMEAE